MREPILSGADTPPRWRTDRRERRWWRCAPCQIDGVDDLDAPVACFACGRPPTATRVAIFELKVPLLPGQPEPVDDPLDDLTWGLI